MMATINGLFLWEAALNGRDSTNQCQEPSMWKEPGTTIIPILPTLTVIRLIECINYRKNLPTWKEPRRT